MTKWQPIETAPRDGTPALVYCPETGKRLMGRLKKGGFENIAMKSQPIDYTCLTHWMPLPQPPEGEE